jgi:hypothetical protein
MINARCRSPASTGQPRAEASDPASMARTYFGTSEMFWTKPSANVEID